MSTFDTGLSFFRAPFIASVALLGAGAAFIDISARLGTTVDVTGFIGFLLIGATVFLPVHLFQSVRSLFPYPVRSEPTDHVAREKAIFQEILNQSVAASNARQQPNHAICSDGQTDGKTLKVGA